MRKQQIHFNVIALGLLLLSCGRTAPEMNCNFKKDQFIEKIKTDFSADSVAIFTQSLQEEMYFPEIRSITVVIVNPKTPILNFKELPLEEYVRFDNYEEIELGLKEVSKKYALELIENCDVTDLNDIIIEFGKLDKSPPLAYRYIIHFDDLFENKEN